MRDTRQNKSHFAVVLNAELLQWKRPRKKKNTKSALSIFYGIFLKFNFNAAFYTKRNWFTHWHTSVRKRVRFLCETKLFSFFCLFRVRYARYQNNCSPQCQCADGYSPLVPPGNKCFSFKKPQMSLSINKNLWHHQPNQNSCCINQILSPSVKWHFISRERAQSLSILINRQLHQWQIFMHVCFLYMFCKLALLITRNE